MSGSCNAIMRSVTVICGSCFILQLLIFTTTVNCCNELKMNCTLITPFLHDNKHLKRILVLYASICSIFYICRFKKIHAIYNVFVTMPTKEGVKKH